MPPAQLALATLLQASTQVSDDAVSEATTMDRRWQVGLACLDCETPPVRKGTLGAFRQRLLAQQMDRRLLERTGEIAATSGACGARQVRAALDRRPLWGAGRVEETSNLLGHALRKAWGVIARQQALTMILDTLTTVAHGLAGPPRQAEGTAQVSARLAVAPQVQRQESTLAPDGTPSLRQGVPADRRISVEDAERRHGRKSRRLLVDGYKRHVLRALASRLIVAVGGTPATVPAASVTDAIAIDRAAQQSPRLALHIDRAYLARKLVQQRPNNLTIVCKAWPVQQGPYFSKKAFQLEWERHARPWPGGEIMPFEPGEVGQFPAAPCACGALRERCTTSAAGRSVTIPPDEALVQELRERQQTPQGRAKLRERVAVAHALAHVGRGPGRRARYRGVRKNVFDLRRCAVVHHFHVLMRLPQAA